MYFLSVVLSLSSLYLCYDIYEKKGGDLLLIIHLLMPRGSSLFVEAKADQQAFCFNNKTHIHLLLRLQGCYLSLEMWLFTMRGNSWYIKYAKYLFLVIKYDKISYFNIFFRFHYLFIYIQGQEPLYAFCIFQFYA